MSSTANKRIKYSTYDIKQSISNKCLYGKTKEKPISLDILEKKDGAFLDTFSGEILTFLPTWL